jgi:hypothetical protein
MKIRLGLAERELSARCKLDHPLGQVLADCDARDVVPRLGRAYVVSPDTDHDDADALSTSIPPSSVTMTSRPETLAIFIGGDSLGAIDWLMVTPVRSR